MNLVKEILSFYTPHADVERMEKALQLVLEDQIVSYHHDATTITLDLKNHEYLRIRYINDIQNNVLFKEQIHRSYQSVLKKEMENVNVHQNLLYQIALFHGAYVLEFNYNGRDRDKKILPLMDVADRINALIFWESGDVSDSYGDIILRKNGASEMQMFSPFDGFDINNNALGLSKTQLKRMHHSITVLRYKGIYAPNNIAPPLDEQNYVFQDVDEILKRCIACMLLTMYADYLIAHTYNIKEAYAQMEKLMDMYHCASFFTSNEIEFLSNPRPNQQEVKKYQGYFECCYTLLWVLGFREITDFPESFYSDSSITNIILQYDSIEKLHARTKMRSKAEILDAQDIVQRYVWACRDAQKLGFKMPPGLCSDMVNLRYQSLYWVINETYYAWDEVPCVISPLCSAPRVIY